MKLIFEHKNNILYADNSVIPQVGDKLLIKGFYFNVSDRTFIYDVVGGLDILKIYLETPAQLVNDRGNTEWVEEHNATI